MSKSLEPPSCRPNYFQTTRRARDAVGIGWTAGDESGSAGVLFDNLSHKSGIGLTAVTKKATAVLTPYERISASHPTRAMAPMSDVK